MSELLDMKRRALSLGLCGKYKGLWDDASSKEDLMRIAMDANGISFIADGAAFGWGLNSEYLRSAFKDYINGYTVECDGYTSQLWVGASEIITTPQATQYLFIDCDIDIVIPQDTICAIHAVRSKINIKLAGDCEYYEYGDKSVCVVEPFAGNTIGKFTPNEIKTSEWRK
jgi:hypothetical protein